MPPYIREIWDWLLKEANHSDKKSNGSSIKRGQLIRTFKDIQEGLKWMIGWRKMTYKKWQCENAMKFLRERTMITTMKTTRGMLITICNYSLYQDPINYESNRRADRRTTDRKQTTDTINKNVKNNKYLEKDIKESGDSFSLKPKKEGKDPLEFSFEDKCWWGLYDWRIKMYQGAFPMLTVNYLFNDKWKTKFLSDPGKYKKIIKEKYKGEWDKLVYAWLQQAKKFYIKDHPDYEERG